MRSAISHTTPWKRGFASTSGGGGFRSSISRSIWPPRPPFSAWAVGALSAPGISLHRNRDHAARVRAEYSAAARQSFRHRAIGRPAVRSSTPPILRRHPCSAYWVNRPYMVGVQFAAADGGVDPRLHRALFLAAAEAVFQWAAPFLLAIAVLLPPLAMTGTHRGAHEVAERAAQPQWRNQNIKPFSRSPQRAMIEDITLFYFPIFYGVGDRAGICRARRSRMCSSAGAERSRCRTPTGKVRVPSAA